MNAELTALLTETHKTDAIFSVVSVTEEVKGAVPSVFTGIRWATFDCVERYFKNPNSYITGEEAYAAANSVPSAFLLWRNIDGISLISVGNPA